MAKKVCHMSSVHSWNDVRINLKECQSLARAGYTVFLVAEGIDHEENGVHVIGCGEKPKSRKERMGGFAKTVYEKAVSLNCDIYHFHDPELLPYGIKLKKVGKKVIFDCHEDVSGQIMSKYWIPNMFRWIISRAYRLYEIYAVKNVDAVVAATPHIATLFEKTSPIVEVINNYPQLDDIKFHEEPFSSRERIACYAGGINAIRGEKVMVDAMRELDDIKLILAGPREDVSQDYKNVVYTGRFTRLEVNKLYGESRVGLVIFQPEPNHIKAKPNKMFEYMAAGLPTVCSDFPLWREIVEGCGCGICVDPVSPEAVQKAIRYLIDNPDAAQEMGRRGHEAVITRYNWKNEEKKLLDLYKRLLG